MPLGLLEEPPGEVAVPEEVLCPEAVWLLADVLDEDELELSLDGPIPAPIVDGAKPGPDGLIPPVVVIFCPKKPVGGLAWPN